MDLNKALSDIEAIRSQLARGTVFRGYGALTVAATAVLAALAACAQALLIPDPLSEILSYLALWVGTAGLSALLIGVEMVARSRRIHSGLADEMIHAATEQFIPAGIVGALLPLVIYRFLPQSLFMLPGLWQIVFGLGLFASSRSLPRPMGAVGIWYLVAGLATLAFAGDRLSPLAMGVPFGLGQAFMAAVLFWSVEARDG